MITQKSGIAKYLLTMQAESNTMTVQDTMYNKIVETIKSTVIDYDRKNNSGSIWKEPIVEIISANNEKIKELTEIISADHLMPEQILPDAKSIICFFVPFQESIVKSNIPGKMASKEWAIAFIKTNDLIKNINNEVELLMENNGYKAGKIPATHNFDVEKLISNWSHRHIAHIAGMGTFGMNNMLITKNGCCGRIGSIIINYELPEYREIGELKEKCLNKAYGNCGVCQQKCVINAYENTNFYRHKCYDKCLENAKYHKLIGYADICGKCLVGLPCSTREP